MTYYYDDERDRQIADAKALLDTIIISSGEDEGVVILDGGYGTYTSELDCDIPPLNQELLRLAEILNATTSPRPEIE